MKRLGYSPVPTAWKLVHRLKVWRLSFLAFWFPHLKNGDINTHLLGLLWRWSATTYVEHGAQESDGCNYYFIIIILISPPLPFPSVFLTTSLLSLPHPNFSHFPQLLPLPHPSPSPHSSTLTTFSPSLLPSCLSYTSAWICFIQPSPRLTPPHSPLLPSSPSRWFSSLQSRESSSLSLPLLAQQQTAAKPLKTKQQNKNSLSKIRSTHRNKTNRHHIQRWLRVWFRNELSVGGTYQK